MSTKSIPSGFMTGDKACNYLEQQLRLHDLWTNDRKHYRALYRIIRQLASTTDNGLTGPGRRYMFNINDVGQAVADYVEQHIA